MTPEQIASLRERIKRAAAQDAAPSLLPRELPTILDALEKAQAENGWLREYISRIGERRECVA